MTPHHLYYDLADFFLDQALGSVSETSARRLSDPGQYEQFIAQYAQLLEDLLEDARNPFVIDALVDAWAQGKNVLDAYGMVIWGAIKVAARGQTP